MTRTIRESEQWPVYDLDEAQEWEEAVEVPTDLIQRYEAARGAWEAVQSELAALYDAEIRERRTDRILGRTTRERVSIEAIGRAPSESWQAALAAKGGSQLWREASERYASGLRPTDRTDRPT